MAATPPNPPVFSPQTIANSFTTISNHLVGLQNESNTLTQEFAQLGNAPPVAVAQLQQTCTELQQTCTELQQTCTDLQQTCTQQQQTSTQLQETCNQILSGLLELKAEGHNTRARLANIRVSALNDPIAPLHSTTNALVQNFPATLRALRGLTIPQLRSILDDLGIAWQHNTTATDLRNQLRIEIGCGQA